MPEARSYRLPRIFNIRWLLLLTLALSPILVYSQNDSTGRERPDSTALNKKRLTGVLATQGVIYAGSMTGLYFLWYADYPQSSFHFFNDGAEWMQVDKAGHLTAGYLISNIGYIDTVNVQGWSSED